LCPALLVALAAIPRVTAGESQQVPSTGPLNKDRPGGTITRGTACGINCLYLFVQWRGVDISLDALSRRVDQENITAGGITLLGLSLAANKCNVACVPAKLSYSDLQRPGEPCICHLVFDPAAQDESTPTGHYVLVTKADEHVVHGVDGTTGEPRTWRREWFERYWSRHALVGRHDARTTYLLVAACVSLSALSLALRYPMHGTSRPGRSGPLS